MCDVRVRDVAAQVLVKLGADPSRIRQQVIQLLAGSPGNEPAAAGAPPETAPSTSLMSFPPVRMRSSSSIAASCLRKACVACEAVPQVSLPSLSSARPLPFPCPEPS